jgi:hypothetical protein
MNTNQSTFSPTDAQLTEAAETAALLDSGLIEDTGSGYAVRVPGCEPWFFGDLTTAKRAARWAIGQAEGAASRDEDESIVVEGQAAS